MILNVDLTVMTQTDENWSVKLNSLLLGKAALVSRNFSLAKRVEFHMACEDWDKVTST